MSTPKRQHTIPKVYLSNFTEQDDRLTVYSKRSGATIRPYPKDALIRRYYYSQPIDGIDNKYHDFETKLLGPIETSYPSLYNDLLLQNDVNLELFFETISLMRVRSAGFREPFEIALSDYVKRHLDRLPNSGLPSSMKEKGLTKNDLVVAIDPHRSLQAMAYHLTHHCAAIADSSYFLVSPSKNKSFFTSDNPVVWFDKIGNDAPTNLYTTHPTKHTRVFFPINPRLGVVGRLTNQADNSLNLKPRILSTQDTNILNYTIFASAWDHVIGLSAFPNAMREKARTVAPALIVYNYAPDAGAFDIAHWSWEPLKGKVKYHPRGELE